MLKNLVLICHSSTGDRHVPQAASLVFKSNDLDVPQAFPFNAP